MPAEMCATLLGQASLDHLKASVAAVFHRDQEVGATLLVAEEKGRLACKASARESSPSSSTRSSTRRWAMATPRLLEFSLTWAIKRFAGGGFIDRAPQGLAVAHQGVDGLCHAGLGRHPLPQPALKALHIQLSQQQPKRGIRSRLGDMSAEQLIEGFAVAGVWQNAPCPSVNPGRSGSIGSPPAASTTTDCRIPRRIRQSCNALRKLIRSHAAAGFWSGEANG